MPAGVLFALIMALASLCEGVSTIIPLYVYPLSAPRTLAVGWTAVINAKARHPTSDIWVIANPSNGPQARKADRVNYEYGMAALRAAGIKILGYVATGYAGQATKSRSLATVTKDIATWYVNYTNKPDGIFLDEMASIEGTRVASGATTRKAFYEAATAEARLRGATKVVGNTGVDAASVFTTFAPTVDVIVAWENTRWPAADAPARWAATGLGASHLAILVHDSVDAASVTQRDIARTMASFVYSTPGPWAQAPTAAMLDFVLA